MRPPDPAWRSGDDGDFAIEAAMHDRLCGVSEYGDRIPRRAGGAG
jgi:hypothetical protein